MPSYFVPISSARFPKPDLVLFRSNGEFRWWSFVVSLLLLCLAIAFTYVAYLGVVEFQTSEYAKYEEAFCGALVVAIWAFFFTSCYCMWVNDGRKDRQGLQPEAKRD